LLKKTKNKKKILEGESAKRGKKGGVLHKWEEGGKPLSKGQARGGSKKTNGNYRYTKTNRVFSGGEAVLPCCVHGEEKNLLVLVGVSQTREHWKKKNRRGGTAGENKNLFAGLPDEREKVDSRFRGDEGGSKDKGGIKW